MSTTRWSGELAGALGGLPGASRAIVDDGWAPPSEQVGLTGALVAPDLYVAAGISGASQHMAGCSNSRVIVAVNSDAQAPIFKYAHFGIVDDCREVLRELIRLSQKTGDSRLMAEGATGRPSRQGRLIDPAELADPSSVRPEGGRA